MLTMKTIGGTVMSALILILFTGCDKNQWSGQFENSQKTNENFDDQIPAYIVNDAILEHSGENRDIRLAHSIKHENSIEHTGWLHNALINGDIDIRSFDLLQSVIDKECNVRFSMLPENTTIRATPEYVTYLLLKYKNPGFKMTNEGIYKLKTQTNDKRNHERRGKHQSTITINNSAGQHLATLYLEGCCDSPDNHHLITTLNNYGTIQASCSDNC